MIMKAKRNAKKAVAGVLAASMLGASCTVYIPHNDDIFSDVVVDSDLGAIAVPVRITLKPEHAQYLNAISRATQAIIASPEKAAVFLKDPGAFLREKGYFGEVNLDEKMIRFVTALADTDLHNAVRNGDMKSFLQLSKEKNLFAIDENSIFASSFYQEQFAKLNKDADFEQIVAHLRSNNDLIDNDLIDIEQELVLVVMGVVVVVPVVAIAAVAIIAAATLVAALSVEVRVDVSSNINDQPLNTLDIYTLRDSQNKQIVVDAETSKLMNEVAGVARAIFPDKLQEISDTELKNFLTVNFVKNVDNFNQ